MIVAAVLNLIAVIVIFNGSFEVCGGSIKMTGLNYFDGPIYICIYIYTPSL
jgi:hypothetical protein